MKKCYIISFDLKNPGINQQKLVDSIKTAKIWARLTATSYLILTEKTAVEIRDILVVNIKIADKVYIGKLDKSAAWLGLGEDVSNWIRNNQK